MATAIPPFNLHVPGVQNFSGPWQALKIEPFSDGDQKHWPGKPLYAPSDERAHRIKLARTWAQRLGVTEPGVNYYLDELPHGYSLFEQRQPNGSTFYKRLFGHPGGRYYDSIVRFEPHFLWLMSGMEGDCECVLCGHSKAFVPRSRKPREHVLVETRRRRDDTGAESASSAGGLATGREKRARGIGLTYPIDEEGTRDVYKECIQNLFKNRDARHGIKDDIIEEDSIDHEPEHEALMNYLTRIEQQHSFIPRLGELVLWCNYFLDDHYLLKDPETNEVKFYSLGDKAFHGFPDWRAGVVIAVPDSPVLDGKIDFPDILDLPTKKTNLNSSGFRVETIPDPNGFDKSASKQYRYLPLRSIRPLAHWQHVLRGYPRKKIHPSINHALTLMTSISLLEKFEFTGEWPNGSIHCKGVYIGSELITIGDVVRIFPTHEWEDELSQSVLIVSSIRLNLLGIEASHPEPYSPLLSSQMNITLIGSAYTNSRTGDHRWIPEDDKCGRDINESIDPVDPETAKHLFRPVGTDKYGPWYPKHSQGQRYEVSHDQVIGRLYEPYAVEMWTSHEHFRGEDNQGLESLNVDFDIPGIVAGRRYATHTDQRIPDPPSDTANPIMWHLADYRAQGLDISSSNGLDVGPYDPIRTKKTLARWRNVLKVRRGDLTAAKELVISHQRGRAAGTRVEDGKSVEGDEVDIAVHEDTGGSFAKRRGRPPGTKIVDGKLVYPTSSQSQGMRSAAREETQSEETSDTDEDTTMIEIDDRRARVAGGLDGNTSFEQADSPPSLGDEEENVDDDMLLAGFQRRSSGEDDADDADDAKSTATSDPPRRPTSSKGKGKAAARPAPLTKEEIMRSVENGDLADDEDDRSSDDEDYEEEEEEEEEEEWWKDPLPPARGGTEESEGGDYDPSKESQEEWAARRSTERKEQTKPKPKYVPPPGSGYRTWVKDW